MNRHSDSITPEIAGSLAGLFLERVKRSPDSCAYRRYDLEGRCCECSSWAETALLAARWQEAFRREGLQPGDRVAVMLRNCLEWVLFDLAALGLGLVTVPLFVNDRTDNFAMIIRDTESKLLLIEGVEQWEQIRALHGELDSLVRIVTLTSACSQDCDPRLKLLSDWLAEPVVAYAAGSWPPTAPATVVYTSGTTGAPKGVMLSHGNILANAYAGSCRVPVYSDDLFLSFLPLSHTLERTVGYYIPIMTGASVAHVRSLDELPNDLAAIRPTIIISVPLIFERLQRKITASLATAPRWKRALFDLTLEVGWRRFQLGQKRGEWSLRLLLWPLLQRLAAAKVLAALGGRVRLTISGGAPLAPETARFFLSLGLNLLQGYGLTETSPVVAVNTPADNRPESVGLPLPGIEVALGKESELLIRGQNVMSGYWRNPHATAAALDKEGWLHSGDQARILASGHIVITGRLKEIIVLANGEKVSPAQIETALGSDRLFKQIMVVGDGRAYLTALLVLNDSEWARLATQLGVDASQEGILAGSRVEEALLARIAPLLAHFPGYTRIHAVHAGLTPWRVQDGLLTATLKLRRRQLLERYAVEVEKMYAGH